MQCIRLPPRPWIRPLPSAVHKAASKAVHKAVADASTALKNAGHTSSGRGLHPHANHPVAGHHSAHHPHAGTVHHHSDQGQGTGHDGRDGNGRGQHQGELRGTHKVLDAPQKGTAGTSHSQHPMKAVGVGLPDYIKQFSSLYAPTHHIDTAHHTHQGPVHQDHAHQGAHVHQQHPH